MLQDASALVQVVAGTWEVLATSLDELQAFGAKLQRSLRPADKKIADQVRAAYYTTWPYCWLVS